MNWKKDSMQRVGCWTLRFHMAGVGDEYDPDTVCMSKNYWNEEVKELGIQATKQAAGAEFKVTQNVDYIKR